MALEAVTKIDAIFDIERQINGLDATSRLAARQRLSRPLVEDLRDWMQAERDTMSRHNPVAKAIAYMFKAERWPAFTRFLEDGRVCLTNNAAERASAASPSVVRNPTHPVSDSDNIRSRATIIRSPRDVAAERGLVMSPWTGWVKRFGPGDAGAVRGAARRGSSPAT